LSLAAHDALRTTWCCIQKLGIIRGEGQYSRDLRDIEPSDVDRRSTLSGHRLIVVSYGSSLLGVLLRTTQGEPGFEEMLKVTSALRQEQEEEARLYDKSREQRVALQQAEAR
jgi:hypothetical protein